MYAVDVKQSVKHNEAMPKKRQKPDYGRKLEQRRFELANRTMEEVVNRANDTIDKLIKQGSFSKENPHPTNITNYWRIETGVRKPFNLRKYELVALASALEWTPKQLAAILDITLPKSLDGHDETPFMLTSHQSTHMGTIKSYDPRFHEGLVAIQVPKVFLQSIKLADERALGVVVSDSLFMDETCRRDYPKLTELWCVLWQGKPQVNNVVIIKVPNFQDVYGVYLEQGQPYVILNRFDPPTPPVVVHKDELDIVAVLTHEVRPRVKNLQTFDPL